jgi:hypothetical protein
MKKEQKKRLDATLCKHAYTDTIEALARIAAFTTSRSLEKIGHGEYYSISEELFKKDIILFSISIRRLAELTHTKHILNSRNLKTLTNLMDNDKETQRGTENCWNLIGNIIHSSNIIILKSESTISHMFSLEADILEIMQNKKERDAVIIVKSEKFPNKTIQMIDFCVAINEATDEINDVMSDEGVFVGHTYEL